MKGFFFFAVLLFFAAQGFARPPLFNLKQNGQEQYQDVYSKGRILEKASYGERYLEDRFAIVNSVFERYQRPFTVLDVGASQGYFSFRGADLYPDSVFVMLEGSNPSYPLISKQLSSICEINNHVENVVWLNRSIHVEEVHELSLCEHFDVVLLLNILHWFPSNWMTLLDAARRMSHVTIVEVPPLEESLSAEHKDLRLRIHSHLSGITSDIIQGVPRHTDPSHYTTYYIVESSSPSRLPKTSLLHPISERQHHVIFDYANKILDKADSSFSVATDWVPGINLITYLMFNGAFPSRTDLIARTPTDWKHRDWMPNNMIVGGKKLVLIDQNDPRDAGSNPCSPTRRKALAPLLSGTLDASPDQVKAAFVNFCNEQ